MLYHGKFYGSLLLDCWQGELKIYYFKVIEVMDNQNVSVMNQQYDSVVNQQNNFVVKRQDASNEIVDMKLTRNRNDNSLICNAKVTQGYEMWFMVNKNASMITIKQGSELKYAHLMNDEYSMINTIAKYCDIIRSNFLDGDNINITLEMPDEMEIRVGSFNLNKRFNVTLTRSEMSQYVIDRIYGS